MEKYQGIVLQREYNTKVAGTSFHKEGLVGLRAGTQLSIEREPDNEHDPNAVKVCQQDGTQVGYLNKDLAAAIAPAIDSGFVTLSAVVTQVTGGTEDKPNQGVNILIKSSRADNLVKSPQSNEFDCLDPDKHR